MRKWIQTGVGVWLVSIGLGTSSAPAVTPYYYETIEQRTLATGFVSPRVLRLSTDFVSPPAPVTGSVSPAADPRETGPSLVVEAGEIRLFGIADLRLDGFRVEVNRHRWGWFSSVSNVSSPLGSEMTGGLGGYIQTPGRVLAGWRVGGVQVDVPPYSKAGLVTLSASLASEPAGRLRTGGGIEDVRLAGEPYPGADVSAWVSLEWIRTARFCLEVRLCRWGGWELGMGGTFRLGRACSGLVGFDNASRQIKAALCVSGRSLGCGLGAMVHPVLGVSKEIRLRWQR